MTSGLPHSSVSGPRRPERTRILGGRLAPILPVLLLVASGSPLEAQEEAEAILRGRIVQSGGAPLADAPVVLHRVSADSAGALDSLRTDAEGRFRFRLPAVPDPDAGHEMFFASTRYRDILYFGPAIAQASQLDSLYTIQVHDTMAAPPDGQDFVVEIRNVFLESAAQGWRVTDLFQLRNDSNRTVVSSEGRPVWTYPLPPQATGFQVGQSDLAPDAVRFNGHVVSVTAPVPPGERLFVFRYDLPDLETSFPTPGRVERMEVLVQEPAEGLSVEPLQATQPVEMEPGVTYRRFAGQGLRGGSVTLSVTEEEADFPVEWVAVILALLLGGGAMVPFVRARREPSTNVAGRSPGPDARRAVLLQIARLDEEFAAEGDPSPERRKAYERQRARFKERLRALTGEE